MRGFGFSRGEWQFANRKEMGGCRFAICRRQYARGEGRGNAQIKKSRRRRKDKAGSSNKEWLYKQKLYSKD